MKTTKFYHIALLIIALIMTTSCTSNQKSDSKETVVLENIATRVSVRSYLDKPVDDATIEKLLRAGMAAPSAVNKQPWHFVVVTDKQQLSALAEANPNAGMAAHAPLAIVVCGNMERSSTDLSAHIPGFAFSFPGLLSQARTHPIDASADIHRRGLGACPAWQVARLFRHIGVVGAR